MAIAKLINYIAITSLVILACSFSASPASALSIDVSHHGARALGRDHASLAKSKRETVAKRCKSRPVTAVSTVIKPTSLPAAPTKSNHPASESPKPTPKPSPTSTPPPPPPPSSNSGGGKVGLAWAVNDDNALANFKTPKVSSIYTWSPWIPAKAKSLGYDPIPMLWGEKQVGDFQRLVVKGYANTVLGFNEPNQQGQSDMSPQRAAQLWKQYIQPLKAQGYNLISPACTNAPSGKTWMKDFFAACDGCHFDGLAIHHYGTSAQDFINYINDFHTTFNLPIWPTEFACQNFGGGAQCSKDQVFSYMTTVKNFMDNSPAVARYFAFGALYDMGNVNPANQLLGPSGKPTDLGYLYIN